MVSGAGPRPSHSEMAKVFLKISLTGFGGPNAHLALVLDEVVERRRWITREHFLNLMGVTNIIPGPNSSQVIIHIGYAMRGWTGALTTGLAFLVPTFVILTTLAWLYFSWGSLPRVEPLFWALKPVILAVIVAAGIKLGRAAVTRWGLVPLAVLGAVVSGLVGSWAVVAMALGGLVTWWMWRKGAGGADASGDAAGADQGRPALLPLALGGGLSLGAVGTLGTVFLTHLWIGCVLFGGGYVLIALLEPLAVDRFGWLTSAQFLDGVALSQAVPGPISTLSAFVGYGAAGLPGALLGTVGIYLPAFAAVLLVAPHLERLRSVPAVKAALEGVNAVVAGAVLGVAATLVLPAVPDAWAGALAVVALGALVAGRVPAYLVVLAGLGVGVVRVLAGI